DRPPVRCAESGQLRTPLPARRPLTVPLGADLYNDLAAGALGRFSQVRHDVLLQQRSEPGQRLGPIRSAVEQPDGHQFVVAGAGEIDVTKAGAVLGDRWNVLLQALDQALLLVRAHRTETKMADVNEH